MRASAGRHTRERQRNRTALLSAALWYSQELDWPVAPGTRVERSGWWAACSCGDPDCPAPGGHPADEWWHYQATTRSDTIQWWWSRHPDSAIILPTGHAFDVMDVPERAGRRACAYLDRVGARVGPVAMSASGRCQFLVAPGSADSTPAGLETLGSSRAELDLRCHGDGDYIAGSPLEPMSVQAGRWERPPLVDERLPPGERILEALVDTGRLAAPPHQRAVVIGIGRARRAR
ncbi:MAG: bifunctional DNA primase/polymerase [Streptomycetales bacterium]